jgi:hypothetical protein
MIHEAASLGDTSFEERSTFSKNKAAAGSATNTEASYSDKSYLFLMLRIYIRNIEEEAEEENEDKSSCS